MCGNRRDAIEIVQAKDDGSLEQSGSGDNGEKTEGIIPAGLNMEAHSYSTEEWRA